MNCPFLCALPRDPVTLRALVDLAYLAGAACFIIGLKFLSSPRRARAGNAIGAAGMLLVIVATLSQTGSAGLGLILGGIALGAVVGLGLAFATPMTAMPEMVGLLNGFGGAASALVATAEYLGMNERGAPPGALVAIPLVAGVVIGWVTLTGSLVASGKLREILPGRPITYPLQNASNVLLGVALLALSAAVVADPASQPLFWTVTAISLALGILMVVPIGGGDMPVVICLMNAYSGLAACATGFAIGNDALIISGSLVGSSGIILTVIMCRAMNRSVANVFFGAFGAIQVTSGGAVKGATGTVRGYTAEDAATVFEAARRVVIVPGYGMAVAQAQHAVKELAETLEKKGIEVAYAIHPVAGRMPGHMNVLLAEANVPYELLLELEQVNSTFVETDVALVVGANDIVNPAARHDRSSPIFGMPILDADRARTVMVIKRSMRPGFAGIDNELYLNPKTMMLFGDAKKMVTELAAALKS